MSEVAFPSQKVFMYEEFDRFSNEKPLYAIDPGVDAPPYPGVSLVSARAEELLPAVCDALSIG